MQNAKGTKALICLLLLLCFAEALWILVPRFLSPALSRIIQTYPVGEDGVLSVVISDAGGAPVPFTYRYYLHARIEGEQQTLEALREGVHAFLVTRDGDAKVEVDGDRIRISVRKSVYSFSSPAVLQLGERYIPISIWLDAQPEGVPSST